jgi:hypothetical protein
MICGRVSVNPGICDGGVDVVSAHPRFPLRSFVHGFDYMLLYPHDRANIYLHKEQFKKKRVGAMAGASRLRSSLNGRRSIGKETGAFL